MTTINHHFPWLITIVDLYIPWSNEALLTPISHTWQPLVHYIPWLITAINPSPQDRFPMASGPRTAQHRPSPRGLWDLPCGGHRPKRPSLLLGLPEVTRPMLREHPQGWGGGFGIQRAEAFLVVDFHGMFDPKIRWFLVVDFHGLLGVLPEHQQFGGSFGDLWGKTGEFVAIWG